MVYGYVGFILYLQSKNNNKKQSPLKKKKKMNQFMLFFEISNWTSEVANFNMIYLMLHKNFTAGDKKELLKARSYCTLCSIARKKLCYTP